MRKSGIDGKSRRKGKGKRGFGKEAKEVRKGRVRNWIGAIRSVAFLFVQTQEMKAPHWQALHGCSSQRKCKGSIPQCARVSIANQSFFSMVKSFSGQFFRLQGRSLVIAIVVVV